ncbi:MAG: hypothetical protein FJ030_03370 [Chloroflexi bacterium]|nr:hypothetical protein [Chloroflexota bacterium]
MSENEIPEIKRESSGGVPVGGLVAIIVLALAGAGLVFFALFGMRDDEEGAAIAASVAAFSSPTPVAVVVHTSAPSSTPVSTLPPASATPSPTLAFADTATAAITETATAQLSPTVTRTRSAPVVTATFTAPPPTATPAPVGRHGVIGSLTLCDPGKPSFATTIEGICVIETIKNTTDSDVRYGALGVQYINNQTGESKFQCSWCGDLFIAAGCTGPTGTCGGPTRDNGWFIHTPGAYTLNLAVCFSDINTCLGGNGDWETLAGGIQISVINWTPSP